MKYLLQSHSKFRLDFPSQLRSRLMGDFEQIWDSDRQTNRLLGFYNLVKPLFGSEKYIDVHLGYIDLKIIAQFRMSSHKYIVQY